MKPALRLLCALLTLVLFGAVPSCGASVPGTGADNPPQTTAAPTETETKNPPEPAPELTLHEVGGAYEALSPSARMPWDIRVYGGYVYVGGGNFDSNESPRVFRRLPLSGGGWEDCGECADEQITRLLVLGGRLVCPGTDPRENWDFGNFYTSEPGGFVKHRTVTAAVHTFDMVSAGGLLFTGDGVEVGTYPVAVSKNGGVSFSRVPFLRDGKLLDMSACSVVRVYDLAVLNGTVYAVLTLYTPVTYNDGTATAATFEIYRYENGVFVFDNDWTGRFPRHRDFAFVPIPGKAIGTIRAPESGTADDNTACSASASAREALYFAAGALCMTTDMKNITVIPTPACERVYAVIERGGDVFAAGYRDLGDGRYRTTVYRVVNDTAAEYAWFEFFCPVISFDFDRETDTFWFGFGPPDRRYTADDPPGLVAYAKRE